jgi:hypothetical protein
VRKKPGHCVGISLHVYTLLSRSQQQRFTIVVAAIVCIASIETAFTIGESEGWLPTGEGAYRTTTRGIDADMFTRGWKVKTGAGLRRERYEGLEYREMCVAVCVYSVQPRDHHQFTCTCRSQDC